MCRCLTQALEDVAHRAEVHLGRAVEDVDGLAQLSRQVLGRLRLARACALSVCVEAGSSGSSGGELSLKTQLPQAAHTNWGLQPHPWVAHLPGLRAPCPCTASRLAWPWCRCGR
jgi:hypothetical protein